MAQTKNGTSGPLTTEEIKMVQDSWKTLYERKNRKANGIQLFYNLFVTYPTAKGMFKQFKETPIEEVKTHPKLAAHATSVMYNIAAYIDNLEETEDLIELIRKTARTHVDRGVGSQEFKWLIEPVMSLLDDKLGDDSTPALKDAWMKVFEVIVAIVSEEEHSK